ETDGVFTPGELLAIALGACNVMTADFPLSRRLGEDFTASVNVGRTKLAAENRYTAADVDFVLGPEAADRLADLEPVMRRAIERGCTVARTLEAGLEVSLTIRAETHEGEGSSVPRQRSRTAQLIDAAVTVPSRRVSGYVASLRADHPEAGPEELIEILASRYLWAVSGSGGAVGAAAAFPVVGTTAALALTAGQVTTFLAASSVLCLAVAEVHGIATEDAARRRALLLTT